MPCVLPGLSRIVVACVACVCKNKKRKGRTFSARLLKENEPDRSDFNVLYAKIICAAKDLAQIRQHSKRSVRERNDENAACRDGRRSKRQHVLYVRTHARITRGELTTHQIHTGPAASLRDQTEAGSGTVPAAELPCLGARGHVRSGGGGARTAAGGWMDRAGAASRARPLRLTYPQSEARTWPVRAWPVARARRPSPPAVGGAWPLAQGEGAAARHLHALAALAYGSVAPI